MSLRSPVILSPLSYILRVISEPRQEFPYDIVVGGRTVRANRRTMRADTEKEPVCLKKV